MTGILGRKRFSGKSTLAIHRSTGHLLLLGQFALFHLVVYHLNARLQLNRRFQMFMHALYIEPKRLNYQHIFHFSFSRENVHNLLALVNQMTPFLHLLQSTFTHTISVWSFCATPLYIFRLSVSLKMYHFYNLVFTSIGLSRKMNEWKNEFKCIYGEMMYESEHWRIEVSEKYSTDIREQVSSSVQSVLKS